MASGNCRTICGMTRWSAIELEECWTGYRLRQVRQVTSGLGTRKAPIKRSYKNPRQIFTCSSILINLSAESTPKGGYLSSVFSRLVT
jgi:hypothetical protein